MKEGVAFLIAALALGGAPPPPLWGGPLAEKLGLPSEQAFALMSRAERRKRVPELARAVSGKVFNLYWDALDQLGALGPDAEEAVPVLARTLRDDPDDERVVETLGKIGPPARLAEPWLARAAGHRHPSMRRAAIDALEKLGPSELSIPALRQALAGPDCARAAAALSRAGRFALGAAKGLAAAAAGGDRDCAFGAAVALHRLGPAGAAVIGDLIPLLDDARAPNRLGAALALSAMAPSLAVDGAALMGYGSQSFEEGCRGAERDFKLVFKYLDRFEDAADALAVARRMTLWVLQDKRARAVDLGPRPAALSPFPARENASACLGQAAFPTEDGKLIFPILTGLKGQGFRLSAFLYDPHAHAILDSAFALDEVAEIPPLAVLAGGFAYQDGRSEAGGADCRENCGALRGRRVERIEQRALPCWWRLGQEAAFLNRSLDRERSWENSPVRRFFPDRASFEKAFGYEAGRREFDIRAYRLAMLEGGARCIFPSPDRKDPYDEKLWLCD